MPLVLSFPGLRVFAGIPCPRELLEAAALCQRQLDGVPGIEHLDPGNLHLTIIPPWDERDPAAVVRDLSAISMAPFKFTVTEAGFGPSQGAPRLAWLVGERSEELDRLWLQAWRALWSQDPPRPAFSHVTVSRFPERSVLPEITLPGPVTGTIDRVVLYESLGGGRYRVIGERLLG